MTKLEQHFDRHQEKEHFGGRHQEKEMASDLLHDQIVSDTTALFASQHIVPNVVDHIKDEANMTIIYDGREVVNGQDISLDDLATEPQVQLKGVAHHEVFTLLMIDPDMPSPSKPKYKDTLYWMAANIKGSNFEHTEFIVEYMSPEPAQGKHRYVFLLFKHPDNAYRTFKAPSVRVNFQTKQWANEHGLGDPVAGVFVTAQHK